MYYGNARVKGEPVQGSVVNYYHNLEKLVNVNDGRRNFSIRTEDCHDANAPFNQSQETRLRITHMDHDVSQITEGFINMKVRMNLSLSVSGGTAFTHTEANDPNHIGKVFVGFKSSNQILDQLQIYSNNFSTDYQQNECCREGFCYSTIKPYAEKKTRKYTHSLYENVDKYSQSVCGCYIDLYEFAEGTKTISAEFELILPFDDILALQAFDLYPNSVVGDIELRFYVKPRGLVWCQVDPRNVLEVKNFMEDENFSEDFSVKMPFKHQFTQIGNFATICAKQTDATTWSPLDVKIDCTSMFITACKSNMYGFGVKNSTIQAIREIFSKPVVIPSQQLFYNAFPLGATTNGIQSTINMPLVNTTSLTVAFPKHANDYTVFENPVYDNVQLTINGVNYPDDPISTMGARFLQYQLAASDLDGPVQCTKEFEDSLTMPKNHGADGIKYSNTMSDASSFMLNIQTERSRGGYLYDGLDSGKGNVPIQLRGVPIHQGEKCDSYYYIDDSDPNQHPPPPQLFICRDTYFTVDTQNGLQYHKDSTPPESQVAE